MQDFSRQAALNALMRPRMVCVCRRVPETWIREVLAGGAQTFEEVQRQTNCSTGCGTCEGAVRALVEKYRRPPPAAG
jgi:bacterioferritin-associated ferredoxin